MALTSVIFRVINQGADQLVTEHHTDTLNKIYVLTYATSLTSNLTTLLNEHKEDLEDQLALAELEELLNG